MQGDPHHRYRSWEHCYGYFQKAGRKSLCDDLDQAALQLGFYLASWGMYRGSSFLLQKSYTVHKEAVRVLASSDFEKLWNIDFGASDSDAEHILRIRHLLQALTEVYKKEVDRKNTKQPTDTLLTKIILGTIGILPAYDRYFIAGLKHENNTENDPRPNEKSINWLLKFCRCNLGDLQDVQQRIKSEGSPVNYPLMKLIDMYFWEIGMKSAAQRGGLG